MCSHHHHSTNNEKNLIISIFLNLLITISQFVGGILSGSLALLSDALHNFSDVISLTISYIAEKVSKRKFTEKHTFGYKRAEIVASLINSMILLFVSVYLIYSAGIGFLHPTIIVSYYVIILALVSILLNGISVLLLFKEAKNNLNIKTSYIHLLTDMITSVAVLIGGIIMYYFHIYWIDNLLTVAIGLYLLYEAYKMTRESILILMNFTPDSIDLQEVYKRISDLKEIKNIHHIHIWNLTDNEIYIQGHLDFVDDLLLSEVDKILIYIEDILKKEFQINHCILQPEFNYNDDKALITEEHNH